MKIIKRAILSVYNKHGVDELARFLVQRGVEILSTGGTARLLKEKGIPITDISEVTGFPEMLGGRVKTLHPAIHGPILAMESEEHMATLQKHGLDPIDLVVVNLYPFEETINKAGITEQEAIEMIDIGGPTMIRAAAKNYARVSVLCDPRDYETFMDRFEEKSIDLETRRRWALKVFKHTSTYDTMICNWLKGVLK